jgi:predicted nicotinamide N-methyase
MTCFVIAFAVANYFEHVNRELANADSPPLYTLRGGAARVVLARIPALGVTW